MCECGEYGGGGWSGEGRRKGIRGGEGERDACVICVEKKGWTTCVQRACVLVNLYCLRAFCLFYGESLDRCGPFRSSIFWRDPRGAWFCLLIGYVRAGLEPWFCFHFLWFFSKKRVKWPARSFMQRGRIFLNYRWFCEKITTYVTKNDFLKKFRANYHTLVVQIWITFKKWT